MTHRFPNRFPILTSFDVGGAGLEQSESGGRNVFLWLRGGRSRQKMVKVILLTLMMLSQLQIHSCMYIGLTLSLMVKLLLFCNRYDSGGNKSLPENT